MAQRHRRDLPGSYHHVMNRGIARRSVFETREDVRYFLSRLARAVRDGGIEVQAYSLMTNHFHLLVRSPRGDLAQAIGRVENAYVRWFNRLRRRDGPLFRGRFRSRVVEDADHRRVLVRYIDHNPVEARMCARPELHPWGSAWHYARKRGPPWLARTELEAEVIRATGSAKYPPEQYARVFGARPTREQEALVEVRLDAPGTRDDDLGELLADAPDRVRSWLARRARAADGRAVRVAVVSPASVLHELERERSLDPEWTVTLHGRPRAGWPIVEAGLLRVACALTVRELALRTGASESTLPRWFEAHQRLCAEERGEYALRASRVLEAALDRDHRTPGGAVSSARMPRGSSDSERA
jgi:REP element-mobilizing transposase RayT